MEVEAIQDNEQCAIVRGPAQDGVHLIKEVRAIEHHNVELERKGNRDGVDFKCRSR